MALTKVTSGLISADAASVDLNIDAGTLYIDATNNKVGIGNSSPANNSSVANNLVVGNGTAGGIANYVGANLGWYAFSRDNANNTDAYDGGMSYDSSRNLKFHTNAGTERLTINGAGDMHLGQSDSDVKFYISSTGGGFGGNASHNIRGSSSTLLFNAGGASGLYTFEINGSEKMRLNSNGSLLIGTTATPTYSHKLVVEANNVPDGTVQFRDSDVSCGLANTIMSLAFTGDDDCTSATMIAMYDSNSLLGSISVASGTSVSYNTSSDERLKENIVDATSQLETIKNVQVREFNWKRNGHHELGLIAQELLDVIPNVVREGTEDLAKYPYSIDYGKLTPYIIKAVQEQQVLIEQLQAEVALLKGE